jgi:hypothetical protein
VTRSRGVVRSHALTLLGYAHEAMGRRAFDRLRYTDAIGHFHQMHD